MFLTSPHRKQKKPGSRHYTAMLQCWTTWCVLNLLQWTSVCWPGRCVAGSRTACSIITKASVAEPQLHTHSAPLLSAHHADYTGCKIHTVIMSLCIHRLKQIHTHTHLYVYFFFCTNKWNDNSFLIINDSHLNKKTNHFKMPCAFIC